MSGNQTPPIRIVYLIPSRRRQLAAKSLNSSIAATISTSIMYPLDMSKTRIQSQRTTPNGNQLYSNMMDCVRKVIKSEGVRGLYRGIAINLAFIVPEKTVKLLSNDVLRSALRDDYGSLELPLKYEMIAGAGSGAVQSIVSTPMELLKINLQDAGRVAAMNKSSVKPDISARKIALDLVREKGIFGLWRGIKLTTARNMFFSFVYFPTYFTILNTDAQKYETQPRYWNFVCGCLAGGLAAGVSTPLDVVKTRIQRLKLAKGDETYENIMDAFKKISKAEGPLALFKGATIRVLLIAPLFGIMQTVYLMGIGERLIYKKIILPRSE